MRTRFPLRSTSVMESLLDSDILAGVRLLASKRDILHRAELESD